MENVQTRDLYLTLLKKALTCELWEGGDGSAVAGGTFLRRLILRSFGKRGIRLMHDTDLRAREEGRDWPAKAQSMVGAKRLNNIQECVESVIRDGVPGDMIETGVWRGGSTILMRAVLKAWGVTDRTVWVADSFEGLPPRNLDKYPGDVVSPVESHKLPALAVSLEQVQANFQRYGLLDEKVQFLKGWFKDTLTHAPIQKLAVARLDGDLYESTMDAIVPLYPKISPGGYLIIDDYGGWPACKQAIDEYRQTHGIIEPIQKIDWTGVYWRKQSNG